MKKGVVGFTSAQRRTCALALDDELALRPYSQRSDNMFISTVEFEVDYLTKKARDKKTEPFPAAELAAAFIRQFAGQFLTVSQKFVLEYAKQNLQFVVQRIEVADLDALTGAGDDADADADADKKSGEKKKKKKKKAAEDAVKIDATEAQRGVLLNSSAAGTYLFSSHLVFILILFSFDFSMNAKCSNVLIIRRWCFPAARLALLAAPVCCSTGTLRRWALVVSMPSSTLFFAALSLRASIRQL